MELLKLKPDVCIFLHHLLWILWVPALVTGLYFGNFFNGNCEFLAGVVVFLTTISIYRTVDVHLKDLELSEDHLTETFKGQIIIYIPWADINYARVVSTNRWLVMNKHLLIVIYGDPDNERSYGYLLSQLSDRQRKKAIDRLKLHITDFEEITI